MMPDKKENSHILSKQYNSIDLGCGANKKPDAWGVDHFAYPGVDQIIDLDKILSGLQPSDLLEQHLLHK